MGTSSCDTTEPLNNFANKMPSRCSSGLIKKDRQLVFGKFELLITVCMKTSYFSHGIGTWQWIRYGPVYDSSLNQNIVALSSWFFVRFNYAVKNFLRLPHTHLQPKRHPKRCTSHSQVIHKLLDWCRRTQSVSPHRVSLPWHQRQTPAQTTDPSWYHW